MKVVLAGGSGNVGAILIRHFLAKSDEIVVLSRSKREIARVRVVRWDGSNPGDWCSEFEGADVVINLAGRSVNCRYNKSNLEQMMDSRVDSTRIIGEAISKCKLPPKLWLQASTATIYAHRFDAANDEFTGIFGGDEPDAPPKWNASIEIAKAWERAFFEVETPRTRKVAMRSSMTMSADKGSVFDVLYKLAKKGVGGRLGDGKQFVSWIHEVDFARALDFLIANEEFEGAINICSPNPLPQGEFVRILRSAAGRKFSLPTPRWLVEIGCFLMKTESELVLKSRRVIPTRLLEAGFEFQFPIWESACQDLAARFNTSTM